ncbi:hypothetical protein [Nocardia vaccinii]|uniref:hypothetical protein n=1 Tax=Nocardia vaccinii TaxID=1822 RepID=UPI00082C7B52|nr:hypothetical protein [Nocardia vaccinii]
MVSVNPQIYYDAAKKLTDIGTEIDAATSTLVKSLWETGSMSGSSAAARSWAESYDARASSAIGNARRLAQSLPFFASLVALAGYNHAIADYNADINPHKGAAPTKPVAVAAPLPLSWASAPSAGGPGNGLVSLAALTERIHVHIPDGDTDKLGTAAKAWNAFITNPAIDNAGSKVSDVANALRQNQAHETADLDDLVMLLSGSANKVYAGAKNLATDCDKHKQALDQLRKNIKQAIEDLEAATALTLIATIFADVITAGVGVIVDAATLAAYGVYFDEAATAITGFVEAVDLDRLLTVFSKEEDAAASIGRDLDEIDSLTPQDIEEGLTNSKPAPDSAASGGTKPTAQQAQQAIQQADRTGSGMKIDAWHRSASFPVDEIGANGSVFEITGGDGVTRTLVQMPGEVNGVPGRFEWIIDGNNVTHQMFVRNGTINGVPIKP